ncbi:TIR domain-containing protein [Frankia sp. AgB1.9]|uniref:nSTAND1 domain-containing NTPase n=1 Tax=unclassified Frankia TaxID=2632575 RepID=UPI001934ABD2|nr:MULTISPECIES: TIR domain-containing protein [unclassified Frankia]MBL7487977.1 TIR domain-containing protein [Frankia sp. AgW1.1]MBL7554035.1 TIR domain-containing protein [Frankia sp. AgB1.9]MBL7620891.1 TIR domain-containing protein [Frankia sp. AgB1.8]
MARVFISHARADVATARSFGQWLAGLGHAAFLAADLIGAGEDWEDRLLAELRAADAVVCFVSEDFLRSRWCIAEIATARAQGKRIIPLGLGAEPTKVPTLERLQRINWSRDEEQGRARVRTILLALDGAGGMGWPDNAAPFPGLRPFDWDTAWAYVGRSAEVIMLAESVRQSVPVGHEEILLVVGPSGCGKSSLVRAGLVPMLAAEEGWWALPPVVPGQDPVAALASAMARASLDGGPPLTSTALAARLRATAPHSIRDAVTDVLAAIPRPGHDRPLVIVDQLDDLLSRTPAPERARFAAVCAALLRAGGRVVGTLRSELVEAWQTAPELAGLATRLFPLAPLVPGMLPQVITEPARRAGITVQGDLVAALVSETGSGEALPLLAYVLEQLSRGLHRGDSLSMRQYVALGGVAGALSNQADAALQARVDAGRSEGDVLTNLLTLVTLDRDGRPARQPRTRDELSGEACADLDAFLERRLLTSDTVDDAPVLTVAHERFLTAWPPLARRISDEATALRTSADLDAAAREWERLDRPTSHLWEPARVELVTGPTARFGRVAQRARRSPDLSPASARFVDAVRARRRRRRRRAASITAAVLSVILAAASVAWVQRGDARAAERSAIVENLITQLADVRGRDPRLGIALGLAGVRVQDSPATRAALLETLAGTNYRGMLTGVSQPRSLAVSPDGKVLAVTSYNGTIQIWTLGGPGGPRLARTLTNGHVGEVTDAVITPDSRTLITSGADQYIRVWDISQPAAARGGGPSLEGFVEPASALALSSDGRMLAGGGLDSRVVLWDISDPVQAQPRGEVLMDNEQITSLVFGPADRTLYAATSSGALATIKVIGTDGPDLVGPPLTVTSAVGLEGLAVTPDRRMLFSTGRDGRLRVWSLADPLSPKVITTVPLAQPGGALALALAPDGQRLATFGDDGTIGLWDTTDPVRPAPLGNTLTGHEAPITAGRFTPDGKTIVTASNDGTVRIWDVVGQTQPRVIGPALPTKETGTSVVALSPDGSGLVAAGDELNVWTLANGHATSLTGNLPSHSDSVTDLEFSPKGDLVVTASLDETAQLWRVSKPFRLSPVGTPLTGHPRGFTAARFTSDEKTLVTAGNDHTVRLWDISRPDRPVPIGQPLTEARDPVHGLALSPDDHTLFATTTLGDLLRWDIHDPAHPKLLGKPYHLSDDLDAVQLTPDGTTLVTGRPSGFVDIWNVRDPARPAPLAVIAIPGQPRVRVNSIAISGDGTTLVAGVDGGNDSDGTIHLWDIEDPATPRQLGAAIPADIGLATKVALTADGTTLTTIGRYGQVSLWQLDGLKDLRAHLQLQACARLDQNVLTREEWRKYLPPLPYNPGCGG